jgi:hypothetical protein
MQAELSTFKARQAFEHEEAGAVRELTGER